jgi:hypothetical protein
MTDEQLELLLKARQSLAAARVLLDNGYPDYAVSRLKEMAKKFQFYNRYGVEEHYVYDPDSVELIGWLRSGEELEVIEEMNGWNSPRLGIKFQLISDNLEISSPSGERFLTFVELAQLREQERQRADEALTQLEQERQRYQALEALLRERGINPEQL